MNRTLRVAILKMPDCTDGSLEPSLLSIDGVRVVAQLTLADELSVALKECRPDVLMVALGDKPAHLLLGQIGEVIKNRRELCVILAGPKRDPDLLLTAIRAGVREFAELPTRPELLIEILQKMLEGQPTRQMGKLLVFMGAGGGNGTSTVAGNVAVELARSGVGRVALVDLDIYTGQLAAMLDLFPTFTVLELCAIDHLEAEHARIESVMLKHSSGVHLLARPKEPTVDDLPQLKARAVEVIQHLQEMFDFVLVDVNPYTDVTEGRLATMADEIVLVAQPQINAVHNSAQLQRLLNQLQCDLNRLRLVINRVPRKLGSVRIDSVEKSLKRNVFWQIPEDYEAVSESLNLGIPLSEHATASKARCSIRDLAQALVRADHLEKKEPAARSGLLRRIFKDNVA
ncbi:MAG: hypothetical protein HJJLKODD_01007 [Phycisphaerae bacterium]|nr:hypothetical protein [Phycisphaerae bacterium]